MTNAHPSLTNPFVPPEALQPKIKMRPNDLCWCGSKIKWKKCHKDREQLAALTFGQSVFALATEFRHGRCLHPLASHTTCSRKVIQAHTIQKRGGLFKIQEEGHVLSVKAGLHDLEANQSAIVPKRMGIRLASTFNGFCSEHDAALFRPIEAGSIAFNTETAFLLAFRAIAFELLNKEAERRGIRHMRMIDRGHNFEMQVMVQQIAHLQELGVAAGLATVEQWKASYDRVYADRKLDSFHFFAVEFDSILPVVACGAFMPEVNFSGKRLQILSRGDGVLDIVSYNLTTFGEHSFACFGWLGNETGPAADFVQSFRALPDPEKATGAIRLAFEQVENSFIKPSWWKNLRPSLRFEMEKRFRSGTMTGDSIRSDRALADGSWILDADVVIYYP